MFKLTLTVGIFLLYFVGYSQGADLPADMRQHTLTQYNASLFNPAFSLDKNNPQSIAFWTRWQWQNVDDDPTTLFLNYTASLNDNSAAGGGFFQHNTGIYFNTGAAVNYSYEFEFNRLIKLAVGANIFGFSQELADTRFPVVSLPGITESTTTNDFILQVAPGFNLQVENFSLSLASENLFDYNFNDKGSNTASSDKIFMGMASYDFPVMASDSTAVIRPSIYLRTIPEQQNQIGVNALFSTKRYWVQSGFNNFYGVSVGAGGTIFNRFSLGALVEYGINSSINSEDPSFEILFSYYLGETDKRRASVASGVLDEVKQEVLLADDLEQERLKRELEQAEKSANQNIEDIEGEELIAQEETKIDNKEAKRIAAKQKKIEKQQRKDAIAEAKRKEKAVAFSENQAKEQAKLYEAAAKMKDEQAAAELLREQQKLDNLKQDQSAAVIAESVRGVQQRILDSIQDAQKRPVENIIVETQIVAPVVVDVEYDTTASAESIEPGFYLVVNIFGTKKYFDNFISDLSNRGLQPKSFYRKFNKYNYVYLKRYETMNEAKSAEASHFDGRYTDKITIFAVGN